MLNIYYGDMEEVIYNTSSYFKFNYDPKWFEDPNVVAMVRDVDQSVVLGNGAIDSPVLGVIAPVSLSGGVKTLILIDKVADKVFNASNCGDNCAEWLLRIGKEKDVTVNLRHMMDFGDDDFEVKIVNTGEVVHNMDELLLVAGRYV
ncbi:MAG: DUF4869 domain-containing protein [Bacillota bacterium]|nr:DUF4869 domain-containing protein [Bacillota bacterium]